LRSGRRGLFQFRLERLCYDRDLAALGIDPVQETPQAFAKFVKTDYERSAKLLKAANFQPE
jgi:hypothetical protein